LIFHLNSYQHKKLHISIKEATKYLYTSSSICIDIEIHGIIGFTNFTMAAIMK